ncbi:glutathione peroxidase [Riemerella anatipestifer]|uniref:glutathione peroxidase n=1 Tax=Riemerella anatipestifer TaxID=34085 RepID=UPI00236457B2|nr:glutathione peroxidase [Riemerella anatipestifer]MDD1548612.1 glutathione peroxidase [Riemerella anatipestifer]WKV54966.1 glutathione peroxidase [Riemerella anatipestifer]WKV57099.1 glutathione peroxidase [Riemerella anatipestifer]WKV59231.1 glutathione peroxidase [Riemerella anatipestifer]
MKKFFILMLSVIALVQCSSKKSEVQLDTSKLSKNIYDYKVESLDGGEINFADFKGKKILIVNTASECGFTPQYEALEKLYQKYKDRLVVVGFPANNFGGQEPGTNTEIKTFCQVNYGVTFPMAAKVSVKGGDIAPIFQFLTKKELNGVKDTTILWNFTKFLLDENGKIIESYLSTTKPDSDAITKHLK